MKENKCIILIILFTLLFQNIIAYAEEGDESNLWILGIGINLYRNFTYLANPVNDTLKIIECLKNQEGKRYNNVYTYLLFDRDATKRNIENSFQFFKNAKPNDIIMLYINAHGETMEDGTYCFYPYDTEILYESINTNITSSQIKIEYFYNDSYLIDIEILPYENTIRKIDTSTVITIYDIIEAMNILCKKILFLETCGSGGALNFNVSDMIVFAACGQNEYAVEDNELGHGSIFTDGFVRKINNYNYIETELTVEILFDYMYNHVIRINSIIYNGYYNDKQHPEFNLPDEYKNFIIAYDE